MWSVLGLLLSLSRMINGADDVGGIPEIAIDQVPDTTDTIIDCTKQEFHQYRECTEFQPEVVDQPEVNIKQTVLEYCTQLNSDCLKKCGGQLKCQNECPVCPLNADKLVAESVSKIGLSSNCRQYTTTCLKSCKSTECSVDCIRRGCRSAPIQGDNTVSGGGIHTVIVHQENTVGGQANSSTHRFESKFHPGQNITTVIRLSNVMNNTNHVEAPVNIISDSGNGTANAIDLNEVTPKQTESASGGAFGLGYNAVGSCCLAIRPKSCRASTNGLRCHHRRHRTCGPQCTAHTIHVQLRQHCQHIGDRGCRNGIAYVPQPRRPNCVYIEQWPFVSCSLAFERQFLERNCAGCYDHYGFGFHQFHEDAEHHRLRCRGCYDDGFEYGPLYRRGPVLRPYFYHQAPCYVTGRCRTYERFSVDCGHYGCFGDQFVDPVWGRHRHRPHSSDEEANGSINGNHNKPVTPTPKPDTNNKPSSTDSDVLEPPPTNPPTGETKNSTSNADDWGVQLNKCKVVSDDGSIEVKNCSDHSIDTNPYAASPVEDGQPDQEEEADEDQYLTDYNDEDNDDIGEEVDDTPEPEELIRATRSHGKHKRPSLVYDDFEDDYGYYSGRRNKHARVHRERKIQKRGNRSRDPRRFRIVYDDVDADDYE